MATLREQRRLLEDLLEKVREVSEVIDDSALMVNPTLRTIRFLLRNEIDKFRKLIDEADGVETIDCSILSLFDEPQYPENFVLGEE